MREQRVVGLQANSAAARAGLREGDELAGWTLHGDPDRKIELKVLRDDKVKTISYFPRGAAREMLQFSPAGKRSGATRAGSP
jgi:hypothetical protein